MSLISAIIALSAGGYLLNHFNQWVDTQMACLDVAFQLLKYQHPQAIQATATELQFLW